MKFTWGTGIFLFYTIFAGSLFYQVYKSTQYDHSLVAKDYYAKDIAYQTMYEKQQNSLSLAEPLRFDYQEKAEMLYIVFPSQLGKPDGKVTFYRPQTRKDDVFMDLVTNKKGQMIIPLKKMTSGRWHVQVDWVANKKAYYDELILDIPQNP